ncbi:MAG: OmpH family outer membrane protein [Flavobacteriales bacterium]
MNLKSNLIQIILGAAVVALFILHFTGSKTPAKQEESNISKEVNLIKDDAPDFSEVEVKHTDRQPGSILVAYIDEDTLSESYEYAIEIRNKIEKNTKEAQGKVEARIRQFQQEYQKASEKAPTLYQDELAKLEKELMDKEQAVMKFQQQVEDNVLKFQEAEFKKYNEFTRNAINTLAEKMGYDIIFIKKPGTSFIYINNQFDITDEVISYLNKEYKNRKNKKD